MADDSSADNTQLDPDSKVARLFGVTDRTIARWDQDPELGFPRAIEINGRKYRRRDEIRAFQHAHLKSRPAWCERLISELASAPRDQVAAILHQYDDSIDALPPGEREKLLAAVQDVVAEIPKETD